MLFLGPQTKEVSGSVLHLIKCSESVTEINNEIPRKYDLNMNAHVVRRVHTNLITWMNHGCFVD